MRWKGAASTRVHQRLGRRDALDYDRDGKCWGVGLDPEVVALFAPDEHTWVHLDTRLQLGKSYLAKWLSRAIASRCR